MAKSAKIAWGIDIGNCSLKALKLGATSEGAEVLDYAVIKHEKILSQPDVDPKQREELIRKALSQFMSQHDVGSAPVVVAVPGHSSFARFIKLPPVESKRIGEIVRFEAIQQIPFDIEDVEWDWQTFTSANDPEVEVGIFAIKKDLVSHAIDPFSQSKCPVHMVQMAPMALYNFLQYDQQKFRDSKSSEATILLDIGAENTDLVIADGRRVWQRSIPIGGNQFTAAVQKAFKLGFSKAEAIKRTASTSKYARQIFQAMRSVFADLAAEIQRSLGFYSSGNREVQFREVMALGSALRLPGLTKFLQQSLSLPIKRLDSFESLKLAPDVSVAQFTENLPALPLAYGLALQGLGEAAIISNLLPTEVARMSQWQRKRRWFIAASTIFLIGSLFFMFDAYSESSRIQSPETKNGLNRITGAKRNIDEVRRKKDTADNQVKSAQTKLAAYNQYFTDNVSTINKRALVPYLYSAIRQCVPNKDNTLDQAGLYDAYRNREVDEILKIPRPQRKQVFLNQINIIYTDNLSKEFDAIIGDRLKQTSMSRTGGGGASSGERDRDSDSYYSGEEDPYSSGRDRSPYGEESGRGGRRPDYSQPSYNRGSPMGGRGSPMGGLGRNTAAKKESIPGFVVVIEGTTTHHGELSFLFPPNVSTQREQWGFFNRLRNLGKTDAKILEEEKSQHEPKSQDGSPRTTVKSQRRKEPNQPPPLKIAATSSSPLMAMKSGNANEYAKKLPFETYFDPEAETVEAYFDISRRGWLSGTSDTQSEQPYPGELGLLREEKEEPQPLTASRSAGRTRSEGTLAGSRHTAREEVYLDYVTLEPITDTFERDENGEIKRDSNNQEIIRHHDYWFQVRFKVQLKQEAGT
jgi:type IV pilus assembly protein PilM